MRETIFIHIKKNRVNGSDLIIKPTTPTGSWFKKRDAWCDAYDGGRLSPWGWLHCATSTASGWKIAHESYDAAESGSLFFRAVPHKVPFFAKKKHIPILLIFMFHFQAMNQLCFFNDPFTMLILFSNRLDILWFFLILISIKSNRFWEIYISKHDWNTIFFNIPMLIILPLETAFPDLKNLVWFLLNLPPPPPPDEKSPMNPMMRQNQGHCKEGSNRRNRLVLLIRCKWSNFCEF